MIVDAENDLDKPVAYIVTGYGGRGIESAPLCKCAIFHIDEVATCITCHTVYSVYELEERSNQ